MVRPPAALWWALALSALASPAEARDPVAAEALFRSGRDALKREDYAAACAAFEESQRLDPAGGTALNLAACERGRGHIASASVHLREALDLLPPGDDRVPLAQKQFAELQRRLPHLTVRLAAGTPAGAAVTRDDLEVKGALLGLAQPVDPGRHVVRVSAPGRADRSYEVVSIERRAEDLVVEPGDVREEREARRGVTTRTKIGLVVGGFGLAATGLGVVLGVTVASRGNEKRSLCPANVCSDANRLAQARDVDASGRTLSIVSTVAFGAGAAALAASAYLLLTGSPSESPVPAVTLSKDGVGLGVSGSF